MGIETRSLESGLLRRKLSTLVAKHVQRRDVAAVIALTDVYPDFASAAEAKQSLARIVGDSGGASKFRAHAAQFEVEAWIMPFWPEIAESLNVKAQPPGASPELIDGEKPPSFHLRELYARARRRYEKPKDGPKWLTADRLERSAARCPELKSFLNSILEFAGAGPLP